MPSFDTGSLISENACLSFCHGGGERGESKYRNVAPSSACGHNLRESVANTCIYAAERWKEDGIRDDAPITIR